MLIFIVKAQVSTNREAPPTMYAKDTNKATTAKPSKPKATTAKPSKPKATTKSKPSKPKATTSSGDTDGSGKCFCICMFHQTNTKILTKIRCHIGEIICSQVYSIYYLRLHQHRLSIGFPVSCLCTAILST